MRNLASAARSLRRTPTLTLAVVVTLALCIGATTAIFSVICAVLFRPLPFSDPDGILAVRETWKGLPGSMSVGGLALLLAAVGVYGVISYGVTQRTQEIGIRVALGADDRKVLRPVVGQAAAMTGAGLVLGLTGALGRSGVIAGLLFQVSPTDPPTLAAGVVLLAVVALLAAAVPARRAARVDPAIALRAD